MIESYKKNLFRDFSSWFTELADLAENVTDNSSLPKLELLITSGNTIAGSIIHCKKKAQDYLLMILGLPDELHWFRSMGYSWGSGFAILASVHPCESLHRDKS